MIKPNNYVSSTWCSINWSSMFSSFYNQKGVLYLLFCFNLTVRVKDCEDRMIEPSWYRLFLATKVSIERKNILTTDEVSKLQGLYHQMLGPAMEIQRRDLMERGKDTEPMQAASISDFYSKMCPMLSSARATTFYSGRTITRVVYRSRKPRIRFTLFSLVDLWQPNDVSSSLN